MSAANRRLIGGGLFVDKPSECRWGAKPFCLHAAMLKLFCIICREGMLDAVTEFAPSALRGDLRLVMLAPVAQGVDDGAQAAPGAWSASIRRAAALRRTLRDARARQPPSDAGSK
ncbi:hypothetical protein BW14_06360 [Bifidobacterium sp. UTBIF-68]|nr:hypothetical protein BW14_06360 [Bifidobacterium sp. UTBIF-68]